MADDKNQSGSDKEIPILSRLRAPIGAVRNKKRKGRGIGKLGKTAGKGMKGQKARSPGNFQKLGFEGGQMPLYRRIPKRGFHNLFATNYAEVNVRDLERFEAGSVVDEAALREKRLVSGKFDGIKLLGNGEVDRSLTIKVHAASAGAKAKVEAAGGTLEILGA
ncbi:MAG: 50S ribosomal protein L15 [Sandaracinaceae bacterium]|nr:50S ribosomal protein L15 [Sandaracinaceae bacterium]